MTSTLNTLKSNIGSRKKKLRKGRGIAAGQGASCGFGMRGQKSRSGRPTRPGFEGGQMPLFRKLPQRGFSQARFRKPCSVVNLSDLERITGDIVDAESLKAAGLVRQNSKRIKLLGDGEISKAVTVNVDLVSNSAKEKIEAAGGKIQD